MSSLSALLLESGRKDQVIADCVRLVEDEVAAKKGISGAAVKSMFKLIKAMKPGIMNEAISALLPEFLSALQPHHDAFEQSGESDLAGFLKSRSQAAVSDLLSVTDSKVSGSSNNKIKSAYGKLRGRAEGEVAGAWPKVADLVAKYATA